MLPLPLQVMQPMSLPLTKGSLSQQPVGGRTQAGCQARVDAMSAYTADTQPRDLAGLAALGLPVYDSDYIATVYRESERGTHRAEPAWRDPRWTDAMRVGSGTLMDRRDEPHRQQPFLYRTTLIDPLFTPTHPLPEPDIHKLRYMTGNYMTPDDWY